MSESKVVIPEAAVEAAAKAVFLTGYPEGCGVSWDPKNPAVQAITQDIKAALEAAAPHMLAPVHAYLKEAMSMTTLDPNAGLDSYDQGFDDAIRGMADKIRSIMNGAAK